MAKYSKEDKSVPYQKGLLKVLDGYRQRLNEIEKELEGLPQKYSSPEIINQKTAILVRDILDIRRKAKLAAERIKRLKRSEN